MPIDDDDSHEPWQDAVFETLQPPPGGLSRLRSRLDQERRGRRLPIRPWQLALGATVAIAVAVALLWGPQPPRERTFDPGPLAHHPALIRLGLSEPPDAPVTVPAARLAEIAVRPMVPGGDTEGVVLYWISPATSAR